MATLPPSLWAVILGKAGKHATQRCVAAARIFSELPAHEAISYDLVCCGDHCKVCIAHVSWNGMGPDSVIRAIRMFEQHRSTDGMLHPEGLTDACSGLELARHVVGREVRSWHELQSEGLVPELLNLTDFVSLSHGSFPLDEESVAMHRTSFEAYTDQGDRETVPAESFTEGLWTEAACNGMLPTYRDEGSRTNAVFDMLPPSLRPWEQQDARMTFEQYLTIAVLKKLWTYIDGEQSIEHAFRAFDSDGSGFISSAGFRCVLTNLGETFADLDEIIAPYEADGQVNYEECVKAMMRM